jgi:hypothetical protein
VVLEADVDGGAGSSDAGFWVPMSIGLRNGEEMGTAEDR